MAGVPVTATRYQGITHAFVMFNAGIPYAQHRFVLRRNDAHVHDRPVSRIVMLSRSDGRSSQPGAVSATEHAGCRSKPRHR